MNTTTSAMSMLRFGCTTQRNKMPTITSSSSWYDPHMLSAIIWVKTSFTDLRYCVLLCTIVYYFQDDHVFSYYNHTLETGYPKTIQEDFPGVPTHLDAAVECPQGECITDSVLFFKGMLAFTAAKLFSKSK